MREKRKQEWIAKNRNKCIHRTFEEPITLQEGKDYICKKTIKVKKR